MWWFFSGGVITSIGIIAIEKPFHQLALKSVGLLDTLLDPNEGEEKIQKLQTKIIQAISTLLVFIILCIVVFIPTWLLAEVTAQPNLFDITAPLESHWDMYLIGSVLPFVVLKFLPKIRLFFAITPFTSFDFKPLSPRGMDVKKTNKHHCGRRSTACTFDNRVSSRRDDGAYQNVGKVFII